MPRPETDPTDTQYPPSAVTLLLYFLGIPGSTTLLNFVATFIGYGIMQAIGIAPLASTPALSPSNPFNNDTLTPISATAPTSQAHPICNTANLNTTAAMDFARMTVIGTAVTFSAYAIFTTAWLWYRSKDAKETAKNARSQAYSAVGSNLILGPVAGGLTGFIGYCMPIIGAAEMMGAPFSGLLCFLVIASLASAGHNIGNRCSKENDESTAGDIPPDSPETTAVRIRSQGATPRSQSPHPLSQQNSSGLFIPTPGLSPTAQHTAERETLTVQAYPHQLSSTPTNERRPSGHQRVPTQTYAPEMAPPRGP